MQNWGRKLSTAKLSPESASTSSGRPKGTCQTRCQRKDRQQNRHLKNKTVGQRAEDNALNYFQQSGYRLWRRNHRVVGVEIDLILKKQSWFFVEVKKLRALDEVSFRLSLKQKKRLLYARAAWESRYQETVSLKVLFVGPSDMIELNIEDF